MSFTQLSPGGSKLSIPRCTERPAFNGLLCQKSMLAGGVRGSPLLPSCGQAKEPSDTKVCILKLRLEKTLNPPRVMHRAHSCQHFVSGLDSLGFSEGKEAVLISRPQLLP